MISELNDRKDKIKIEIYRNQKNLKDTLQRSKFTKPQKYKKKK